MNLVDIVILQNRRSEEVVDPDLNEPAGPRKYATPCDGQLSLKGQVNFGGKSFKDLTPTIAGDTAVIRGHCVFRLTYLEEKGVTLTKGDLIINIAGKDMEPACRITQVRHQNPLNGQFLLVFAEFEQNVHVRGSK
jgi:hypothetical protein